MAFSSVTIGSGATYKPYFLSDEYRTQNTWSITSNSAHLSPSTGTMLCLVDSINSSVSGGEVRYYVSDSGGGNFVDTDSGNPSGTADASSTRYSLTLGNVPKTVVAGTTYWCGIVNKTTTGVGFLRLSTGETTDLYSSSWTLDSTWSGTAYMRIYYNTVPSQPLSLTATAGTNIGSVNLDWVVPSSNGGTVLTGYKIQWSKFSNFSVIAGSVADTGSASSGATIEGLDPGTTYYFRVAALNAVSTAWGGGASSPYSASASSVARSVGKLWNGSAEVPIMTAVRWDGSAEVAITQMKRWDGTQEVNLQG